MSSSTSETEPLRLELIQTVGIDMLGYATLSVSTLQQALDLLQATQAISGLTLCGSIYSGHTLVAGMNTYGDVWGTASARLMAQSGKVIAPDYFETLRLNPTKERQDDDQILRDPDLG